MDKMDYDLAGQVIGLAMRVHSKLGPGFLESVYQNALAFELRRAGFLVEMEVRLIVKYEDMIVGEFDADMLINKSLLVENKAILALVVAHEVQLVNYLTTTGLDANGAARAYLDEEERFVHARRLGPASDMLARAASCRVDSAVSPT